MIKLYTFLFSLTVAAFASQIFAQDTAIKRASLSTSVVDALLEQKQQQEKMNKRKRIGYRKIIMNKGIMS